MLAAEWEMSLQLPFMLHNRSAPQLFPSDIRKFLQELLQIQLMGCLQAVHCQHLWIICWQKVVF